MSVVLEPTVVAPSITMLSVRTPTLPPATHTNAFVIGSGDFVLVEPASPYDEEVRRLADWVLDHRAAGRRLRAILLTHHHPDHFGGAAALRERLGAPIWAHPDTARLLRGRVQVDAELNDGDRLDLEGPQPLQLQAVHTPGHAPGHLCFWEAASRTLLAGDMVAGVGTIVVDPRDGDMQDYLDSLERMDAMDAASLLPAHGLPIDDPHERLRFYVAHRLAREAKVLAAVRHGSQGVALHELVIAAYADTPPAAWPLATLAAEAHLIKLQDDGLVERRGARWWPLP